MIFTFYVKFVGILTVSSLSPLSSLKQGQIPLIRFCSNNDTIFTVRPLTRSGNWFKSECLACFTGAGMLFMFNSNVPEVQVKMRAQHSTDTLCHIRDYNVYKHHSGPHQEYMNNQKQTLPKKSSAENLSLSQIWIIKIGAKCNSVSSKLQKCS